MQDQFWSCIFFVMFFYVLFVISMEGDPSDSELAKQIFARSSTKIGDLDCGVSCKDFSFLEMTKMR
ncbi:hypothetical protein B0A68_06210 [Flavobacterium reichenbachii]|uniref:Uncharacterized protein n=1 Tax=Flavobacterium reichenbachii TaxID=362418 RepID=A0A085ZFY9_9FLAO|nr:hypothetical protein IW19_20920 [Flavobacterium reichenbachii]OXB16719.1 hypothetical protein B0A68_06210 [Flavobacterium reichenbachii]